MRRGSSLRAVLFPRQQRIQLGLDAVAAWSAVNAFTAVQLLSAPCTWGASANSFDRYLRGLGLPRLTESPGNLLDARRCGVLGVAGTAVQRIDVSGSGRHDAARMDRSASMVFVPTRQ